MMQQFYNQIYTNDVGKFYLTMFLAHPGTGQDFGKMVVFYDVEDKSKVLYMEMNEFLLQYTLHDPFQTGGIRQEWEMSTKGEEGV